VSWAFRWLGVAGVELKAGDQRLAIDPFFTRPSLAGLFRPVMPNETLAKRKLPACNAVLVTHSHWDHVMDVPAILKYTGARAYGTANTCALLRLHGIPEGQVQEVSPGDRLDLGAFKVEVIRGQHSRIPFGSIFNGPINPRLQPPLRLQDYRQDACLGYCIRVMAEKVLVCAAAPQPAGVVFAVAQEAQAYYLDLLKQAQPHTFVPIHWDDFLRPLDQPLRRFTRPGRMPVWRLAMLARATIPGIKVIIPEMFREYAMNGESEIELPTFWDDVKVLF
jgi:L-ascorbate metabolism protein UlaG (beta-lactamase superfamily)